MKLSKVQWILLGMTAFFITFTLAFFLGRSSVHAVITTQRTPEAALPEEAVREEAVREASTEPEPPSSEQINLNTARLDELETLPGIGSVLAERIVQFREENGGFLSPEQLMDVEGIGEVTYRELEGLIYVEELP